MNYKKSIFNKLLVWFVIIGIIPILILSTSYYLFFTSVFTDTLTQQTYTNTDTMTKNVDGLIEEYEAIANTLSDEEIINKAMTSNYVSKQTKEEISIKGYLSLTAKLNKASLYIIDSQGKEIFSTHPLPARYDVVKYKNWGGFRKANNSLQAIVDANKYVQTTGDPVAISVMKAVRDENLETVGYIIIDIYRKNIVDIYNKVDASLSTDLMITDSNLYTIFDMRNPHLEAKAYDASYRDYVRQKKSGSTKEQIGDNQCLVTFVSSDKYDIITIAVTPMNIITENQKFIKKITSFAAWISLLICFVCAFFIARNFSKPIRSLVKSMQQVKDGDFDISVKENRKNPHFLYNTLDSIKWIAKMNDVEEISIIATHLAKLLRNTIDSGNEIITVEESMKTIESYLLIQKIRYSDKFDIHIQIEEEIMKYKIPKLIFQPIVENATIHGLENKAGHGTLRIEGKKEEDHMIFTISDDGVGMDPDHLEAIQQGEYFKLQKSNSIGMQNVDRRIKLYYGKEYGIQVESSVQVGTKIIIKIPTTIELDARDG